MISLYRISGRQTNSLILTMFYTVEYTDTLGGEANYSWVKRRQISGNRNIVRAAKKVMELTGVKCDRQELGDTIRLVPRGTATVLFITPS